MAFDDAHATRDTVERIVSDVVDSFDTTRDFFMFPKQATVFVIQNSVVFYGDELMQRWRKKVAHYPEELAIAMVEQNFHFDSFGAQRMLAEREDVPVLYENHYWTVRRLLFSLFGLNRIYCPGYKWTRYYVKEMSIKPRDFYARLQRVYQPDCMSGTYELKELIEETFDLVEQHLPQIDLKERREKFRKPYKSWKLPEQWAG